MTEAGAEELDFKFVIVPEGFSHTRRMPKGFTLHEMKQHIEADLRIPVTSMKLMFNGQEMTAPNLSDYNLSTTDSNHIEMQIIYMEERPAPSMYVMPDVISVEVQFGLDIPPKLIQVRERPRPASLRWL